MVQNRPWSIWWDFRWEGGNIKYVVVQTDHPQYQHVDYIYRFPIDEICEKDGTVDGWVDGWFRPFVEDIYAGRESLHDTMKYAGHMKEAQNGN